MGQEIRDSVIGFFGFGGISQAIAKRLQCWDVAKIIYHTRTRKENDGDFKAEHVPLRVQKRENISRESSKVVERKSFYFLNARKKVSVHFSRRASLVTEINFCSVNNI